MISAVKVRTPIIASWDELEPFMKTRTYIFFATIAVSFAGNAVSAEEVTQEIFETAVQACGGALSAEVSATFEEAFDAASAETPGVGTASVSVLGMSILRTLDGLQSDEAKVAVLQAYYQCVAPVVAQQINLLSSE